MYFHGQKMFCEKIMADIIWKFERRTKWFIVRWIWANYCFFLWKKMASGELFCGHFLLVFSFVISILPTSEALSFGSTNSQFETKFSENKNRWLNTSFNVDSNYLDSATIRVSCPFIHKNKFKHNHF